MHKSFIRRIIFLLIAVFIISCGSLVYAGTVESSGTCGANATWELDSEGILTISGTGEMGAFDSAFRPYKVTEIIFDGNITAISDFEGCYNLERIDIPSTVTHISNCTFSNCTNLTALTIPQNTIFIGDKAFEGCINLKSVNLPDKVTFIGSSVFKECSSLEAIEIPSSILSIGDSAFNSCIGLTAVSLPDGITSIGNWAFANCTGLTSINIPDSVTSVGALAFQRCTNLSSVNIPSGVTCIRSGTFNECTNLSSIIIPSNIVFIEDGAFWGCEGLSFIAIPDNVKIIGNDVFRFCPLVIIHANVDSYAHEYARNNNIAFQCLSHKNVIFLPAIESSCTQTGLTAGKKCSDCETVTVTQTVVPLKDHKEVIVVGKIATCTSKGLTEGKKCSVCQTVTVAQQIIPAKDHQEITLAARSATCTETGIAEGKMCETCQTVIIAQTEVEKLPHTVATSEVTKKATAKADGEIVNKCACGEVVSKETIAKAVVTLSKTNATYTGKNIKAPKLTIKDAEGNVLVKGTDYTVNTIKKIKDIGVYTYTIKFKGDKYSGSTKVIFTVKPVKIKLKSAKAGKRAVTVKWTKGKKAQVTGYQVMVATNSKFTKNAKTVAIKGYSKTSAKVTKLKAKTKYFVKVRTYKTVKGAKIYSDWSKVKTIRTK